MENRLGDVFELWWREARIVVFCLFQAEKFDHIKNNVYMYIYINIARRSRVRSQRLLEVLEANVA